YCLITRPPTTAISTLSLPDALPISGFPLEYQPRNMRAEPERYRSGHNGADSKSDGRVKPARGFESHPLRHAVPTAASESRQDKRSEEHTSELQSLRHLVCRLLLEKK